MSDPAALLASSTAFAATKKAPVYGLPHGHRDSTANFSVVTSSSSPLASSFFSNVTQRKTDVRPRMKSHLLPETLNLDPIPDTTIPKPWLAKENLGFREWFSYWIVYIMVFIGLAGGGVQCYFSVMSTRSRMLVEGRHGYGDGGQGLCPIFEERWQGSDDDIFGANGRWTREVEMSGFGNGQFEMTTASPNNSFIHDGQLHIHPSFTSDSIGLDAINDGHVFNLTSCTFNQTNDAARRFNSEDRPIGSRFPMDQYLGACSAVSNSTTGRIINPIQSARLTLKNTVSMRYGMVEIRAKMPRGDWLWPAIWMMPRDSSYGAWPRSGEIDIVESRGNGIDYTARGRNYVQGSLNWGLQPSLNGVEKTYSWWSDKRVGFDERFHTYRLEWTPKFLRISVDSRLRTLLELDFTKKPFIQRGNFPQSFVNETNGAITSLEDIWANPSDEESRNAAPFDRPFYLIMNVAVGGRNGWFPEGQGDKPWLDGSVTAPKDFWSQREKWGQTWGNGNEDMVVDYVKMWKRCGDPDHGPQ